MFCPAGRWGGLDVLRWSRRVVLLLLIAKVVAAPFALRPAPANYPSHIRVVVRICAWPVHQTGFTSPELTEGGELGIETRLPCEDSLRLAAPSFTLDDGSSFMDDYTRRAIARPRC